MTSAKYSVVLSSKAQKSLDSCDPSEQSKLLKALKQLSLSPLDGKRLKGKFKGSRTWRVGNWRVIYGIAGREIQVERIEWRDKVYRLTPVDKTGVFLLFSAPKGANMVQYDPNILEKFATKMYTKAITIIVIFIIVCGLIGGTAGALIDGAARYGTASSTASAGIVGFIIGGIIGLLWGSAIAFWYKLFAQVALCQKQIEANTRRAPHTAASSPTEAPKMRT